MKRIWTALGALALTCAATGCGGSKPFPFPRDEYTAAYAAPDRSAYTGDDVAPDPDDGLAEVTRGDGMRVALWIDPDDIRLVMEQHSPTGNPDEWSEPVLLHTAGDGCLDVEVAAAGTTVAATLECYADDAWEPQAPDSGLAVVTTDLINWEFSEPAEFYSSPRVTRQGVVWSDDGTDELAWSPLEGFTWLPAE